MKPGFECRPGVTPRLRAFRWARVGTESRNAFTPAVAALWTGADALGPARGLSPSLARPVAFESPALFLTVGLAAPGLPRALDGNAADERAKQGLLGFLQHHQWRLPTRVELVVGEDGDACAYFRPAAAAQAAAGRYAVVIVTRDARLQLLKCDPATNAVAASESSVTAQAMDAAAEALRDYLG